eukprot:7392342-Pyramimonas_sp.AAC.1
MDCAFVRAGSARARTTGPPWPPTLDVNHTRSHACAWAIQPPLKTPLLQTPSFAIQPMAMVEIVLYKDGWQTWFATESHHKGGAISGSGA